MALNKKKLGGGNSNIFYVHPYLGKMLILTNISQMGWFNHQPGRGSLFGRHHGIFRFHPFVSGLIPRPGDIKSQREFLVRPGGENVQEG